MVLNDVTSRLAAAQKQYTTNEERAMQMLRELTRDLMRDDVFYLLPSSGGYSQASLNGKTYIRLFSSADAAEAAASLTETPICLDTASIVKLAQLHALLGQEGFLLNDRQKVWTVLPFTQFLETFFQDVLEREEAMDPDWLPCMTLCLRARAGETFSLGKGGVVRNDDEGKPLDFSKDGKAERVLDGGVKTTATHLHWMDQRIQELTSLYGMDPPRDAWQDMPPALTFPKPDQLTVQEKKKKLDLSKFKNKKLLIPGIIAVVCAIILIYVGTQLLTMKSFNKFCDSGAYEEAVEYYHERLSRWNKPVANIRLKTEANQAESKYMSHELSYEAASNTLTVLAGVDDISEDVGTIHKTVDSVEASRQAYAMGSKANQTVLKLAYWRGLSSLDTESCAAAQEDLVANKDIYIQRVTRLADGLSLNGRRNQAKWCLELLNYWYPDSEAGGKIAMMSDVESKVPDLVRETGRPAEISEITVSDVKENGYVDLYIRWKNTSDISISEIDFYTIPLSGAGGELETNTGEGYSLYCARDVGPYAPGKGTPTENWAWADAWRNNMIRSAVVQQVIIFYEDGTILSVEDPSILR